MLLQRRGFFFSAPAPRPMRRDGRSGTPQIANSPGWPDNRGWSACACLEATSLGQDGPARFQGSSGFGRYAQKTSGQPFPVRPGFSPRRGFTRWSFGRDDATISRANSPARTRAGRPRRGSSQRGVMHRQGCVRQNAAEHRPPSTLEHPHDSSTSAAKSVGAVAARNVPA